MSAADSHGFAYIPGSVSTMIVGWEIGRISSARAR